MSLQELLLSNSLVCKQWRDIIQRKSFLPCRKMYYEYKLEKSNSRERLNKMVEEQVKVKMLLDVEGLDIIQETKHSSVNRSQAMLERCLPWLLKIYSNSKTHQLPQEKFDNLVNHP